MTFQVCLLFYLHLLCHFLVIQLFLPIIRDSNIRSHAGVLNEHIVAARENFSSSMTKKLINIEVKIFLLMTLA